MISMGVISTRNDSGRILGTHTFYILIQLNSIRGFQSKLRSWIWVGGILPPPPFHHHSSDLQINIYHILYDNYAYLTMEGILGGNLICV
jgi:hypothetical protein